MFFNRTAAQLDSEELTSTEKRPFPKEPQKQKTVKRTSSRKRMKSVSPPPTQNSLFGQSVLEANNEHAYLETQWNHRLTPSPMMMMNDQQLLPYQYQQQMQTPSCQPYHYSQPDFHQGYAQNQTEIEQQNLFGNPQGQETLGPIRAAAGWSRDPFRDGHLPRDPLETMQTLSNEIRFQLSLDEQAHHQSFVQQPFQEQSVQGEETANQNCYLEYPQLSPGQEDEQEHLHSSSSEQTEDSFSFCRNPDDELNVSQMFDAKLLQMIVRL